MKRYLAYKDSGIRWIGEVPDEWDTLKIKWLSPVKRGASPRPIDDPKYFDDNGEFAWVRIADLTASERYLEQTTQTLSEIGCSLSVKRYPGDFFVSIAGSVGKPIITKIKCCIHDGFVYFPLLKINPEYFYYMFSAGELFNGLGKWGTQLNLNTETVGDISVPRPTDTEIEAIVKHLDHKTQLIDTLVEKKQKQIELLREQRAAIINQAVTKGLNPDAKMKDSGIEWLGEVPEHWVVTRLKFISKIISKGTTPSTMGKEIIDSGDIRFLKAENIINNRVSAKPEFYIDSETHELLKRSKLKEQDILFVIAGATIGKVAILGSDLLPANTNQAVSFVRPKDPENSKLLWYWLQSSKIQENIWLEAVQSAQPNIAMEDLGNLSVPFPPKNERDKIIEFLDVQTTQINNLILKAEREIDLFGEYRTTLISEVVTGKIDVRDEVIP